MPFTRKRDRLEQAVESSAAAPTFVDRPTLPRRQRVGAAFSVTVPPEFLHDTTDPARWNAAGGLIAPRIRRDEALQVPAVQRARNLICSTLGLLPLKAYNVQRGEVPNPLLSTLDPALANSVLMTFTYEDLLFEQFAYWRIKTAASNGGWPTTIERLPACDVFVDPQGVATYRGEEVPWSQLIQFISPNPGLLIHGARAIRVALKLNRTAEGYAESPQPLGYLTPSENYADLEDEEIDDVLADWDEARHTKGTAYLPKALAYHKNMSTPGELQLSDAQEWSVLEIARITGIDAEDLSVSTTSRTYVNDEQRRIALQDFVLRPFAEAVEGRLSLTDVTPRGTKVETDWSTFLRTDTKSRFEAYDVGLRTGAVTSEEVREAENKPVLTPEQQARVDSERVKPAAAPAAAAPPAPAE